MYVCFFYNMLKKRWNLSSTFKAVIKKKIQGLSFMQYLKKGNGEEKWKQ